MIDLLRHAQAQHRVAQELEALVGGPAGVLGAPRPVHQRRTEDRRVVDGTAEPFVELLEAGRREQVTQPSLATT